MKEERRDVTGGDSFGPGGSNEPSELVNIYIYIYIYILWRDGVRGKEMCNSTCSEEGLVFIHQRLLLESVSKER